MRNTYLVCYDICDEKRLPRVFKTMRGFGDHLQYSVFECQMTPTDLVRCRHLLSEIIDHRQDQVIFVDLGPSEGRGDRVITALGRAYCPIDSPCIVVDGSGERLQRTRTKSSPAGAGAPSPAPGPEAPARRQRPTARSRARAVNQAPDPARPVRAAQRRAPLPRGYSWPEREAPGESRPAASPDPTPASSAGDDHGDRFRD